MKKRRRIERSKKVVSLIDDDKDVERRKELATLAVNKFINVWINGNEIKT